MSKIRYDIRVERMVSHEHYLAFCPQLPQFSAQGGSVAQLRERIAANLKQVLEWKGMQVASVTLEPEAPGAPETASVFPAMAYAHLKAA